MNWQKLRADCFQLEEFHLSLLEQIDKENWWNIWVPKKFGCSELSFSEGLKLLKKNYQRPMAAWDGRLLFAAAPIFSSEIWMILPLGRSSEAIPECALVAAGR